jgi:glycosyltransferase involved in cell wall biosynthesis
VAPLRLAVVSTNATRVGGAEVYQLAVAQALRDAGVAMSVFFRDPGDAPQAIPGVHMQHVTEAEDLVDALRPVDADVVHVHDQAATPAELRALRLRYSVVRSLHVMSIACAAGPHLRGGRECTRSHGVGCVPRLAALRCGERLNPVPGLRRWPSLGALLDDAREDRVTIVHSQHSRQVAVRNGFAHERCRVLPYFVERPAVAPAAPPGSGAVCFVGRLARAKGADVLIRAVGNAPSVRRWEVVGDGYQRAELEALARATGIDVRFHGWLTAREVRVVMSGVDVVVVPSVWPEPFGIVGLEAMAAGRTVVASRIGGIPEWLDDGSTGILVTPGSVGELAAALERTVGHPSEATRMGRAGWDRVGRFGVDEHVRALLAIYEDAQRA